MWKEGNVFGGMNLNKTKKKQTRKLSGDPSNSFQKSTIFWCCTDIFHFSVQHWQHEITDSLKEAHIQLFLLLNSGPIKTTLFTLYLFQHLLHSEWDCALESKGVSFFWLLEMSILHCSEVLTITCLLPGWCFCLRDLWRAGGVRTLTPLHPGNRLPW